MLTISFDLSIQLLGEPRYDRNCTPLAEQDFMPMATADQV
jgi:hypothetical protein